MDLERKRLRLTFLVDREGRNAERSRLMRQIKELEIKEKLGQYADISIRYCYIGKQRIEPLWRIVKLLLDRGWNPFGSESLYVVEPLSEDILVKLDDFGINIFKQKDGVLILCY